ncbi:dTDP-glucose 4,6-dehydratase [Robertmurraya korlensis]|jgi:dTDP-glucose 4,6-dehydratase|uniref:dTDP-glucose 4,6-dehydratase n=1 Tax=Robertmurraya korlensis TaxID=519977 RepID=UPI000826FBE1|nr:dTDP-glucose 4,6-dehydratase [Robertmurraya korlensis]
MTKEILITGGAGFIGINFVHYLLKTSDYYLTVVDSLTYASNITEMEDVAKNERVRFFPYDVTDYDQLLSVMDREYDTFVHFAAESHVDNSIIDAEPFIYTNIIGTFHLIKLLQRGYAKRMIQISTDEVYGSLEECELPFTEKSQITPNNPYSATKASSDLLALSYYHTHNLPIIITRCSNNYGPFQNSEKFIPKIIQRTLNSKEIPIYGDGKQIRDWLFVEDHCHAVKLVMEKGREGQVYNIGGGNEKTNIEVVTQIIQMLSRSEELIHFIEDRKGHDRRYAINSEKLRNELGWTQMYTFEEGLRKTVDWYVKQYSREIS